MEFQLETNKFKGRLYLNRRNKMIAILSCIILKLLNGNKIYCNGLNKELMCDRKTILRHINALEIAGWPIMMTEDSGYYLPPDWRIKKSL